MKRRAVHQQMRLDRLYGLIVEAANGEHALASNTVLCDALSVASAPAVSELLRELQNDGRIVVETRGGKRRIKVVVSGRWTAWTKPARQPSSRFGTHDHANGRVVYSYRGELPPDRYVERDPCFKCGIPKFRGCRHYPLEQVAA